jgi:hypothetical protein
MQQLKGREVWGVSYVFTFLLLLAGVRVVAKQVSDRTLLAALIVLRIFWSPLRVFFLISRLCTSDLTLIVCQRLSEEKSPMKAKTYVIVTLVVTILRSLIITKEEIQRCTLDLGDRMKAPQRDNGDGLCIVPILLSIIAAERVLK